MQPKLLIAQVGRERRCADNPSGQPPADTHSVGGRGIGERGEGDADDGVHDGKQNCHPEPPLVSQSIHVRAAQRIVSPCCTWSTSALRLFLISVRVALVIWLE